MHPRPRVHPGEHRGGQAHRLAELSHMPERSKQKGTHEQENDLHRAGCTAMTADIVWEATVDEGKYRCEVVRIGHAHGMLTVTKVDTQEALLIQEVGLAYGAVFGPDVDDVSYWQYQA